MPPANTGQGETKKRSSKAVSWARGVLDNRKEKNNENWRDPILRGVDEGKSEIASSSENLVYEAGQDDADALTRCALFGHQDHMVSNCPERSEHLPRSKENPVYYRQFGVPGGEQDCPRVTFLPVEEEIKMLEKKILKKAKILGDLQMLEEDEAENIYSEIAETSAPVTLAEFPNRLEGARESPRRGRNLDPTDDWRYYYGDRRRLSKMEMEAKRKRRESAPRRGYGQEPRRQWQASLAPWIQYPRGKGRGNLGSSQDSRLHKLSTRKIPASNYSPSRWNREVPDLSLKKRFRWDFEEVVVDGHPTMKERVRRLPDIRKPRDHFRMGVRMGRKALPFQYRKEKEVSDLEEVMDWERAINELGSTVGDITEKLSSVTLEKGDGRYASEGQCGSREMKMDTDYASM